MQTAREPRRKVLIRARLYGEGPPMDVCIRDLSSRGLLIQASAAPPRGAYVELIYGNHRIVGRVIWGKDRRFGIESRDRINVGALADGAPGAAPEPPEIRRPRQASLAAARAAPGANRMLGKAMEFAALAALAAALVATVAATMFETLSRPFENVSAALGG